MSLPILKIIWAKNDSSGAHWNHLHVEGIPRRTGTPPASNPGMTDSVWAIYVALAQRFGKPDYFLDKRADTDWTHMGWHNRRRIAGTTTWSQHSWSNAIDIGPYYGVAEQQRFYDFLIGQEDDLALTANEEKFVKDLVGRMQELYPDAEVPTAAGISTYLIPSVRQGIVTRDELKAAIAAVPTSTIDGPARSRIGKVQEALQRIKDAI